MNRAPVVYEKSFGGVAWVTLNRPEVLNAINMAMRDQLWEIMHAVRDDPEVRAVIFKGAGERGFSAGADISEFGTAPSYVEARRARRERDLWGFMLSLDKLLIAAIHGYALGAGVELPMCCDFRIASEDARLGLPEVSLGYIPSAGGTQTLPRHVPPGAEADHPWSRRRRPPRLRRTRYGGRPWIGSPAPRAAACAPFQLA